MRKHKSVTATQVLELIKKQNFLCAISGRTLTPETASLDHIIPLGRGGPHSIENVWAVDHHVNVAKGTMTFDEFVAMCREIVAYQTAKSCSESVAQNGPTAAGSSGSFAGQAASTVAGTVALPGTLSFLPPESGPGAALGADRRPDRDPGQAGTLAHPVANGAQGAA